MCFKTDPYQGEEASDKQRRYFHYSCIALALGAVGVRADLPGCVRVRIEELYGESATGFNAA